ncbi:MAG: putative bifunctional diguanylate cyclase/phosphodiesterase [Acidimicrobiia bacterium]
MVTSMVGAVAVDGRTGADRLARERFLWRFRCAAAVFAVVQTLVETGDDARLSWVALAIFVASVAGSGLALARRPDGRTAGVVGVVTMATDVVYVASVLVNNVEDPAKPVYLLSLLAMFEATIRWRRRGGLVAGVVAASAAAAWTIVVSSRVLGDPHVEYATMRAGVMIGLGVFLGWLVRQLTEQHDLLQGILDTTRDVIVSVDRAGRIVSVNGASASVLGFAPDELVGLPYRDLIHPDDIQNPDGPPPLPVDGPMLLERRTRHRDGTYRWLELSLSASPSGDHLHVSARDITERREVRRRIEESEQRFRSLFEHNTDAVFAFDLDGRFTSVNPATERITGFTEAELLGSSFTELMEPSSLDDSTSRFQRAAAGEAQTYETAILDSSGERIDLDVVNSPIVVDGEIVGVFGVAKDVTQRRRLERQLGHQATHDALTGLPNRLHLEAALAACGRAGGERILLFIDLDRFKLVNDSLGHRSGDEVLVAAVDRLRANVRSGDLLARWAGDEFCVLLAPATAEDVAVVVADRLRAVLAEPFAVGERQVRLSASIGLAAAGSEDFERLVQIADLAMYEAKRGGRNRVVIYAPGSEGPALTQLDLEAELALAIDAGDIGTHYQPIVDIVTGEVRAVEALVRWPAADGTLRLPSSFIPVAEESGLIRPLTRAVLADACRELARWDAVGACPVQVWVNISVADLESPDFAREVRDVLESSGVGPERLVLEVTETMLMRDAEQVDRTIADLRSTGVSFAIDDFGTGYSSLSQLHRLQVAACKVDREFVCQAPVQASDAIVLGALVEVGVAFGLPVVAEGIERPDELAAAVAAGCTLAQGFLLGRPAPGPELDDLLRHGRVALPGLAGAATEGAVPSGG